MKLGLPPGIVSVKYGRVHWFLVNISQRDKSKRSNYVQRQLHMYMYMYVKADAMYIYVATP